MVAVKGFIGTGMYTVREAALYARVSTSLMTRWLFGTKDGQPVLKPQYGGHDKIVSFLDLVQSLAIREIRLQHKVSLAKFRQALKFCRQRGVDYPFARKHHTFLHNNGELVINMPEPAGGYIQLSGNPGQRYFQFVEQYLQDLTFNSDGLANRYQIFKYNPKSKKPVIVEIDPERRFGEPLLPSGHTATTIFEAIKTEGDMETVARVYGIPGLEVETAYRFYNYLNKAGP